MLTFQMSLRDKMTRSPAETFFTMTFDAIFSPDLNIKETGVSVHLLSTNSWKQPG